MVKQFNSVKQVSGKSIYSEAQKSLESVLGDIPFVTLRKSKTGVDFDNKQIDILVEASVSGKPVRFIVEVKSQGEPRFVRMAIAQMKSYLQKQKDAYGIFYGLQDLNGIKVVSDIQLYLDLKSYKGRGEEAAQAVFEQRIKPRW